MPARRELTMRQLRQMLRLAHEGVSARAIGRMLGAARSTVQDNLKRAEAAGLAWPLGAEITDPHFSSGIPRIPLFSVEYTDQGSRLFLRTRRRAGMDLAPVPACVAARRHARRDRCHRRGAPRSRPMARSKPLIRLAKSGDHVTKTSTHGEQEGSAWNGHFGCTC